MLKQWYKRSMDILLIEDNQADIDLMLPLIKKKYARNKVHIANNGSQAFDILEKNLPDLIILDINLPGSSGLDIIKIIRTKYKIIVPIVILTSSGSNKDINKAYASGANAYVQKSLSFTDFSKHIDTLMDFWFSVAKLPS